MTTIPFSSRCCPICVLASHVRPLIPIFSDSAHGTQVDARTVMPHTGRMKRGVRAADNGHYYLYYSNQAGGWGVHPAWGSEQVMLFNAADVDFPHELHGNSQWLKADGYELEADPAIVVTDLSLAGDFQARSVDSRFQPPGSRLQHRDQPTAMHPAGASFRLGSSLEGSQLCPQGQYREQQSNLCLECPRGRFLSGPMSCLRVFVRPPLSCFRGAATHLPGRCRVSCVIPCGQAPSGTAIDSAASPSAHHARRAHSATSSAARLLPTA